MEASILVLAAGMGSRYGGIKQIEAVGPSGEIILDYSVFDALRAGFRRAVFVIRRDIEKDFRERILSRLEKQIETICVFQDLEDLPKGLKPPADRVKPWGTAHAIRAARDVIDGPFAVINADDFYGQDAFAQAAGFLRKGSLGNGDMCMVGYRLGNTLSKHGTVSRGICQVDSENFLVDIEEHTRIEPGTNVALSRKPNGDEALALDCVTSMNLFGFGPGIFDAMEEQFLEFLATNLEKPGAEFFIPTVVNEHLRRNTAIKMKVLTTSSEWFGITYREDRERVSASIRALVDRGDYPRDLWKA